MAYLSPVMTQMIAAVKKTAAPLARDFNELEHLQNSVHADNMYALRAFERAGKILREELGKIKEDYAFISSVNEIIPAHGNYFLVNPIDGFANFAHANGNFAISVAMVENGVLTAAVVYNPVYDEMFFAEKGSGAFKEGFRNQERIRVASNKFLEKALLSCNAEANVVAKAFACTPNVLISGSTALDLAYLSAGKIDAVVAESRPSFALAAGMLLVKEAGGYIFAGGDTDIRSEDLTRVLFGGSIVATNEALRQKIADKLAKKA